jgi:tRNA 2-thiouridine synthesizing protein E
MAESMDDILHPSTSSATADFPHAPRGWTPDGARGIAEEESIELQDAHWDAIKALQEFYDRHGGDRIRVRELHDAMDELFHSRGGMRFLYEILPGGPVAQGCRLAGLEAPPGSVDPSFGSVQ